jgi:type IV pilus assembly protein PilQ
MPPKQEGRMNFNKQGVILTRFLLWFYLLGVLICACSTPSPNRMEEQKANSGILENIETVAAPEKTTLRIIAPGARADRKHYELTDPPRICLDFAATPANDLPETVELSKGPVEKWLVQSRSVGHTGLIIYVRPKQYRYSLNRKDDEILLTVWPLEKRELDPASTGVQADFSGKPRILDISVQNLPDGRTRLNIETNQPIESQLTPQGNFLNIDFKRMNSSLTNLEALQIDPSGGPIKSVRAMEVSGQQGVRLKVFLRGAVPYHSNLIGNQLMIDFEPLPESASVSPSWPSNPPQNEIPPGSKRASTSPPENAPFSLNKSGSEIATKDEKSMAEEYVTTSQRYAGEKLSFEFRNAKISNVLELLAKFLNLNIVYGKDVEGEVSIYLDQVPWDQALEMVLKPNDLTYQIDNNVLWVLPRTKLADMEITEKKRKGALMAAKRLQGVFEAKVVEFIVVRHRPVTDIFKMLVGDPEANPKIPGILDIEGAESEEEEEGEEKKGKKVKIATMDLYLSFDSGTNMIIANGVRAKVDKVKELVRKLDVPEKQVMIEARIVEATTGFTRDLGIEWKSLDGNNAGIRRKWYNADGTTRFDGSFSTNSPASWAPNIGLAFGFLTDGGLGSLALDASLALAQEDQKIKIISAPKVMTKNGGEAFISRGDVDYYSVRTLDTISFQEIPALLSLKVVPTVSADNSHVTMVVEVTDDKTKDQTTQATEEGESTSPPGRTQKKITSTLIVRTGDTVVIGGIYQEDKRTGDSGIPLLKDIPLLGWLFKAERKEEAKVELLIFLTPTVISSVIESGS